MKEIKKKTSNLKNGLDNGHFQMFPISMMCRQVWHFFAKKKNKTEITEY